MFRFVGLIVSQILLAHVSYALTQQQIDQCEGRARATAEEEIEACSAMLNSGKYKGSNLAIIYNNRCSAYHENSEYDKAISDCTQSLKINPSYANAFYNRSLAKYRKEDYDGTIGDASSAIKLNSQYDKAYDTRGNAYSDKGNHDLAIRDYNEALRIKPAQPITLANRCDEFSLIKQFKAALADCNESLRIRPNHANTLAHRALAHLGLGEFDEAIADYDTVLKQNASARLHGEALFGRGLAKKRKGDESGGKSDMDASKALRADAQEMFATYGLIVTQ
jgi:tetratricopeptide (TPR) repeat protein